ncbi:L-fucose:H+ symporter permease [Thermophagus sp. OGC60D27]|uniref:L-fucose:H+ symporter permease n=1 Tax=Thermophagus sp. OGC60D27 TaxID=3458415 RepID=UPI0040380B37
MSTKSSIVPKQYLVPFVVITSLFALWGFANDITNPMVAAFRTVMEISNAKAALIQFAFYGGYATMAIPAALFVQRYTYKKAIMLGLVLYAFGAFLFWPAAQYQIFGFFLVALYIMTFGLAFLETTANPYILSLGDEETATQRLNLAQAFNPMGSLLGMFVASQVILDSLKSDSLGEQAFAALDETTKVSIRAHDLAVIRDPYLLLGLVVVAVLVIIAITKMPRTEHSERVHFWDSFDRLIKNTVYREGVIAQVFYVAAQIMCWTFIIQYAENLGIPKATAQLYNIGAMGLFLTSRFISTFLMKYVDSRRLLMVFAIGGILTIGGTIFIQGMNGLYCLIATSGFMSLMFPTIYGIALKGVGKDATLGAAGLVMAILGGALMPPLQGAIIDMEKVAFLPAVNASFILPMFSFVVIAIFGYRAFLFQTKG